ncbi:MAG: adenylate/guanylate cyclase domain-containing protein, partial [Anaerolineales bacterium]|nr:adenylate/guanylate cyclase domain-containing protein [Anaerolineales bacterium]
MKTTQVDERLPEGTVTFLFTDIEGSTDLLKSLGDRYADLLEEQRLIVRECFKRWDGQEVDTQGDSFFVSFPRATQAVSTAVEIQKTIHEHKWP